jgi:ATP-dependent helicase/nuclease subunit A
MRAEKRYFEIPFSIRTSQKELAEIGGHNTCFSGSESPKRAAVPGKGEAGGRAAQQTELERKLKAGGVGDLSVILSGAIDLVFWEPAQDGKPAGWVIADYKTDKIPIAESDLKSHSGELSIDKIRSVSPEFASIIDFYAPQIRLYTRFWSQITAEPVTESGIYFTSIDRWVRI